MPTTAHPEAVEPEVTKRKVTMRSVVATAGGGTQLHEMTDYVRPDFLEAYLVKARERWQVVEVSDEPDAGPGGYHGRTVVPAELDHPLAGTDYPATEA